MDRPVRGQKRGCTHEEKENIATLDKTSQSKQKLGSLYLMIWFQRLAILFFRCIPRAALKPVRLYSLRISLASIAAKPTYMLASTRGSNANMHEHKQDREICTDQTRAKENIGHTTTHNVFLPAPRYQELFCTWSCLRNGWRFRDHSMRYLPEEEIPGRRLPGTRLLRTSIWGRIFRCCEMVE